MAFPFFLFPPFSLSFQGAVPQNFLKFLSSLKIMASGRGWEFSPSHWEAGSISCQWKHLKDLHKCFVSSFGGRGGFPSILSLSALDLAHKHLRRGTGEGVL